VLHQTTIRNFSAGDRVLIMYMRKIKIYSACILLLAYSFNTNADTADIKYRKEISQYGITWSFDRPVKSGRFITGDWWVVGPVTILKITPGPGPVRTDNNTLQVNRWGDTSLQIDTLMRNGSMIVYKAGNSQGYDSRNSSYKDSCSIKLPFVLGTDLSLVSSISNETSLCNCNVGGLP